MRNDSPTPTEVIASWIPHDARWHEQARTAAITGAAPVRDYVVGLVAHRVDGATPITDDFDHASLDAVVEDLGIRTLGEVDWSAVRDALLVPLRALGRV